MEKTQESEHQKSLQGQRLFEAGQDVGWDQWRFAAQAHHQFSTLPDGGPTLEAIWSHPYFEKAESLGSHCQE